jgi:hypothetical protein
LTIQKKVMFAFVTFLLIFAGLEIVARVALWAHDPFLVRINEFVMSDPVLHHTWIPSKTGIDGIPPTPCRLTINRQSWVEDYDVRRRKPAGGFRIFMVGGLDDAGFRQFHEQMGEDCRAGTERAGRRENAFRGDQRGAQQLFAAAVRSAYTRIRFCRILPTLS